MQRVISRRPLRECRVLRGQALVCPGRGQRRECEPVGRRAVDDVLRRAECGEGLEEVFDSLRFSEAYMP
jgi:hypothetical protein